MSQPEGRESQKRSAIELAQKIHLAAADGVSIEELVRALAVEAEKRGKLRQEINSQIQANILPAIQEATSQHE
jgi:hypothetical protein